MAPEIADSDAESDVGPHEPAPNPTFEGQNAADSQQASLSNVDFDHSLNLRRDCQSCRPRQTELVIKAQGAPTEYFEV